MGLYGKCINGWGEGVGLKEREKSDWRGCRDYMRDEGGVEYV